MSADWVFHAGRVFNGFHLHPTATAVAVTGNRITAVGTDEELLAKAKGATAVDLAGRLLTDTHVHAAIGGPEKLNCDLSQLSGRDAVLDAIGDYAAYSEKPWITGGGWHGTDFPGSCPTKETLDADFTAAMMDPYLRPCRCEQNGTVWSSYGGTDIPGTDWGLMYFSPDMLNQVAAALEVAGFDLYLHVIGDRAVRAGLDAIEHAHRINGAENGVPNGRRHHMAHIQIIHPQDVHRFAALDVTANAQALWACNNDQMIELAVPFIGRERAGWQYLFCWQLGSGAGVRPVSTPDPWQATHVAVNRSPPDAPSLIPTEAVNLRAARGIYLERGLGEPAG